MSSHPVTSVRKTCTAWPQNEMHAEQDQSAVARLYCCEGIKSLSRGYDLIARGNKTDPAPNDPNVGWSSVFGVPWKALCVIML